MIGDGTSAGEARRGDRHPGPPGRTSGGGREMNELFVGIAKAFEQGGWGMYPIAATLVFALAIMLDRVWALYFKANIDKESFLRGDRKSTRLNSSHHRISYAVFCL